MASKSAAQRAAARKQRDKWKSKRWFNIRAPRNPWQYGPIGETLAETEDQLIGRVFEVTQQEFDGDFSKMHVKLRFRIDEVIGTEAVTGFIGHVHPQDHVRRQVRRHRGKIDDVVDVITSDGYLVRLKPLLITEKRIQSSLKSAIRSKVRDVLFQTASLTSFADLQQQLLSGEIENTIRTSIKTLYPVRTLLIRRSEVLQSGVATTDGPSLEEIRSQESRDAAAVAASRQAALDAAMSEDVASGDDDEAVTLMMAAEQMASINESPAAEAADPVEAEKDHPATEDEETEEAPAAAAAGGDAVATFLTIPGVGPATATKLAEAGHATLDDLQAAGEGGLASIKGISQALAARIAEHLG